MRLKNYFAGERVQLRSPLSARAVAERLNNAAGSALWPSTAVVVGSVWASHIRLRCRSSPFEFNAKPVLAGQVKDAPTGSILELRYRAPLWAYCFYLAWYLFLALIVLAILANGWAPEVTGSEKATASAFLVMLLVTPLALHAFGTRNSKKDLVYLLDFLAQHVEVKR